MDACALAARSKLPPHNCLRLPVIIGLRDFRRRVQIHRYTHVIFNKERVREPSGQMTVVYVTS